MKGWIQFIIAMATAGIMVSCDFAQAINPSSAEGVAESFSKEYFNLRYRNAAKYCTKDSEPWLRFATSQISNEDIEILKTATDEAEIEIEKVEGGDNESTVTVTVSNYFETDTIGKCGHFTSRGTFRLKLVKENNAWKVRMANLPRNEKQNPV